MVKSGGRSGGQASPPRNVVDPDGNFSETEMEKDFRKDLGWDYHNVGNVNIEMPWNTIHSLPWKRVKQLGCGNWGTVFLGERILPDQKLFAVKSTSFAEHLLENLLRNIFKAQLNEIKMLYKVRHCKYVVRILGCGRSNTTMDSAIAPDLSSLDVFMEYSQRGDLGNVRDKNFQAEQLEEERDEYNRIIYRNDKAKFPEPYVQQYTYDVLRALQYLHRHQIVHGDVKLQNLLLMEDCVKLADFGGSKEILRKSDEDTLIHCTHSAPEVQKQKSSYPADIYALGCTVLEMAQGYEHESIIGQMKQSAEDSYENYGDEDGEDEGEEEEGDADVEEGNEGDEEDDVWDIKDFVENFSSDDLKDFIQRCVCRHPSDRWTAEELLSHRFITNRNVHNMQPYKLPIITDPAHPNLARRALLRVWSRNSPIPDRPLTKRVRTYLESLPPLPPQASPPPHAHRSSPGGETESKRKVEQAGPSGSSPLRDNARKSPTHMNPACVEAIKAQTQELADVNKKIQEEAMSSPKKEDRDLLGPDAKRQKTASNSPVRSPPPSSPRSMISGCAEACTVEVDEP